MDSALIQALLLFVGSSILILFCGFFLAKYGDVLAELMGWGRLWVGTILLAVATSLPELLANITAAGRNQPELVGGDLLGSNMFNMLILAVVALVFGGTRFFGRVAPQQKFLILIAIALTGLAVLLGAFHMGVSLSAVGLASVLVLAAYMGGIRLVYLTRPELPVGEASDGTPGHNPSLRRTWLYFGLAALGVALAAPVLAFSVEEIAESTGLATSFLGVVAMALVTSMPEASATVAAVRLGAVDLAVGNLYGSCAFNILILGLADPFYREGVLVENLEAAHIAAGLFAISLMGLGLYQILVRGGNRYISPMPTMALMGLVYLGGLYVVFALG